MHPRLPITLAAITAAVAGAFTILSCGSDPPPPAPPTHVKIPANITGPTTAEVMGKISGEVSEENPAFYEPIPPLGSAIAWTGPDGTLWAKYPSGLMIADVRPGHGNYPKLGQTVSVKYVGTLPRPDKEEEFDRSPKDKPLEFNLGKKKGYPGSVIKGWNYIVATMKVGGKLKAWIPAELAYGLQGSPPRIPSNAPLIFEMELVGIRGEEVVLPAGATTQSGIPDLDILRLHPQLGPQLPLTPEPATAPASAPATLPSK